MKTMRTKFLSAVALTAILFASCSNNDEPEVDNGPAELRVSSGVIAPQTRAAANTQENTIVNQQRLHVWVDDATTGEALYEANELRANGSNGFTGGNAMYFPQTGNAVNIYAIHGTANPSFSPGDAFPATGIEYGVIPNQTTPGGTGYTYADLLYAYSKDVARNGNPTTANLTFYHMLSKMELAIKIGAGNPVLNAANNAILFGNGDIVRNGKFTPSTSADMTNQLERATMLTAADSPSKASIWFGQLTSPDFTAANIIYNEAIIAPQDVSGKELTFKLANGGTLKYTIPANTTFESGKKYRYQITLNLTGLTVTSSIENWDPVNAVQGNAEMD